MRSSQVPRRCQVPDCTHEHDADGEPVYIHGMCHPHSPTFTVLVGDVAIIQCAEPECQREIVRLDLVP